MWWIKEKKTIEQIDIDSYDRIRRDLRGGWAYSTLAERRNERSGAADFFGGGIWWEFVEGCDELVLNTASDKGSWRRLLTSDKA